VSDEGTTAHVAPRLVDGLLHRGNGWNSRLEASRLAAVNVTVADFLADFDGVCTEIAEWRRLSEAHPDRLYRIEDVADLEAVGHDGRTGIVFGLQNSAPVAADLDRLEVLWQLGIRVLQLTYNHANAIGDGCLEPRNAGLTVLGRRHIERCNATGLLVDVSHAAERTALDAVEASAVPVVATHVNRAAVVPNPRNLGDEALRAIAAAGGVVGITPYGPLLWDGGARPNASTFVEHVVGMVELLGENAVGIGTDFHALVDTEPLGWMLQRAVDQFPEIFGDYVKTFGGTAADRLPEGMTGIEAWPGIPAWLSEAGLSEQAVRKVCGENWLRAFGTAWGARDA
jgi:membrane dipeptidase